MSVALHIWVSIHHFIMIFVAQVQNNDISRCFLNFFKILFFWIVRIGSRGGRGLKWQEMAQNDKKNCLTLYLSNCSSYDCCFLVHMCENMISPAYFFSFPQNSEFSGFSKFINKCQKKVLRCAAPSSYVCDFFCIFIQPI